MKKFACVMGNLLAIAFFSPACMEERYFGPYHLEAPNEIMEMTAGRTFNFPLDSNDREELISLQRCQTNTPDAVPPCSCQFPVRSLREQKIRVDYHLKHLSGSALDVMVWVGCSVQPEQHLELLPDLPSVGVLFEHHHLLQAESSLSGSFFVEEMATIEDLWSSLFHPQCDPERNPLPAPQSLMFGISLEQDQSGKVGMDFSLRVQEAD